MPTMPKFPPSSIIPENVDVKALKARLATFGVDSDGNKKLLQVRLTLAELSLQQTDKKTEDLLVQWFSHQKPELKDACKGQDVPDEGTIAEMRRALVWDLAERGALVREASIGSAQPLKMLKKTKAKLAQRNAHLASEDSAEDEPAPKPSKPTKKARKNLAKVAELMLHLDSEASVDEEEPAPQPPKLTKKARRKLAELAQLMLSLDSNSSARDEPAPKLSKLPVTKKKKKVAHPTNRSSSEGSSEEEPLASRHRQPPQEPPIYHRAKAGSRKNRPQKIISLLQRELDTLHRGA
jgi:hypothetical protein